jgi:hypothetical protein
MTKSVKRNKKKYDGVKKRKFDELNKIDENSNKKPKTMENIGEEGLPIEIIGEVLKFLNKDDFLYSINPNPPSLDDIDIDAIYELMVLEQKNMQDELNRLINKKKELDPTAKEQIKEVEQLIKIQKVELEKKQMEFEKPREKIRREIRVMLQTYPSKEELLKITNLLQFNVELQFTMLILLFVIYGSYVEGMEIDIDLQKKLMVFFCLKEEKEKRETYLVSLLEINREIMAENYNLTEGTKRKIEKKKDELGMLVINYLLIKEEDTLDDILGYEKYIVDCSSNKYKLIAELARKKGEVNDGKKLVFYVKIDHLIYSAENVGNFNVNYDVFDFLRVTVYGFDKEMKNLASIGPIDSIDFQLPLLETVPKSWLYECKAKSVNFTNLPLLETVGIYWLYGCNAKSVNFTGLSSLKQVGAYWLSKCSIEKVDFTGLSSLKEVKENWFLKTSIEKVDFSGLSSLKKVGAYWLYGCNAKSVNFTGLSSLKQVEAYWLSKCSIKNVDFTGLLSLTEVDDYWLYESSIKKVNCTGLLKLEKVGSYWMHKCPNLRYLDLSKSLSKLKEVGNQWLSESGIHEINYTGLSSLKTVGDNWMSECEELNKVNLSGLRSLEKVGNYWLYRCVLLYEINFTGLVKLKEVENWWLRDCIKLTIIILRDLKSLEKVGNGWLSECSALPKISFTGLLSLKEVGDLWLTKSGVRIVDYEGVSLLKTVGDNWMSDCEYLDKVNLSGLTSLEKVGEDWLSESGIHEINYTGLSSLKIVGDHWMRECKFLNKVNLSGLRSLKTPFYLAILKK